MTVCELNPNRRYSTSRRCVCAKRTVAAAVPLTFGVGLLGCLYVGLTWSQPHRLFLLLLFVVSSLGSLGVYSVRQGDGPQPPPRAPSFLAWTLSDFALIIAGTLVDGGARAARS